jgi:hypothetical protein
MRYTVEISCDDLLAGKYLSVRPRLGEKIWQGFILVALMVTWAFGLYELSQGKVSFMCWMSPLVFFGVGVFLFIFLPWLTKRQYKQHKLLHKPFEIEFTEQSIFSSSEYGNGSIPWTDFVKWRENKKMFLVYQSSSLMHIIPKRIFNNAEEEQTLRTYLTQALGLAK